MPIYFDRTLHSPLIFASAKILAITEQSGKKGEKGSFFDLSKSYLAPNVGGVEESGNNFAFIIIFLFLFFNTLGVLKGVRVYLFDKNFPTEL